MLHNIKLHEGDLEESFIYILKILEIGVNSPSRSVISLCLYNTRLYHPQTKLNKVCTWHLALTVKLDEEEIEMF